MVEKVNFMYILPRLKIMCPRGKFHAHTFGSLLILKKKKKKALKRNSVWFSVQYIKKVEPASEPAQGLFSYADVAWIKLLRDLFLRGKPRQQVAPALRY